MAAVLYIGGTEMAKNNLVCKQRLHVFDVVKLHRIYFNRFYFGSGSHLESFGRLLQCGWCISVPVMAEPSYC